ncbi:molybdopterin synthase sulfur carrier subunit [Pelecanus crispus]|uniref:molybdopterin synthase sulfur carrier subunit n=1 Tax=Pelecanus crispus TaxID=36300 RepID=UPI003F5D0398
MYTYYVYAQRRPRSPDRRLFPAQVSVLYFARSAELAGLRSETLSVPRQITSLQLWEEIVKVHPRLAVIRDQVVFAVRQEYVLLGDQLLVLQPGDEVAIIPPISGG